MNEKTLMVDGRPVAFHDEKNLLEVIRRANIELPTFCYHSELSVYGACRLCIVEIEGRGVQAACSVAPEPGMTVRTQTPELRETRKVTIELLLANHHQGCTTCRKSPSCKLLDLANRLGVNTVRFKQASRDLPLDTSNPALVRDPNKCILCGDCVRMCSEIQGIGAIDFAHRGSQATVAPAYGKQLAEVECVYCGQCAAVCPTGAILPASQTEAAWTLLGRPDTTVVAQIAPAVRVAVGEAFGFDAGAAPGGKLVAALKAIGFQKVYDTSFAADLTILEETGEFLRRVQTDGTLPLVTSCCPAWVTYAERFFPELLPHLSTCKSPQQMFGSLVKPMLAETLKVPRGQLAVVSIMPCTAKKVEARRPEFAAEGTPDVDCVLTTQELIAMIRSAGLRFEELAEEAFDLPFGFKTGAGIIFGNSGGVSEAVVRYAHEAVTGRQLEQFDIHAVRGEDGWREATVDLGTRSLNILVVHGLGNAQRAAALIRDGKAPWDFVEVMACPGGCIGGAGQPVASGREVRRQRTDGLYREDKVLQLHQSQDNPYIRQCYREFLGEVGGGKAHELLHTRYESRKRITADGIDLKSAADPQVQVKVCLGTSCFLRGSQKLLQQLFKELTREQLEESVSVQASFCHERCDRGPTVTVNDEMLEKCTLERLMEQIHRASRAVVRTND